MALDPSSLMKHGEMSAATLRGLIQAAEGNGFRLIDWERYGTPVIDRVVALAEGPASGVGAMLQHVLQVEKLRPNVHIFPRGIPAVDGVLVRVTATAGV
jgi:hypothetical protein